MRHQRLAAGLGLPLILVLAACSSGGGATTRPASQALASQPTTSAPPSAEATASESAAASASAATTGATVEAKPVGTIGIVLVDGATGMTVYIFMKDVKDSGKSVCTGDCLVTWPALSVPAGGSPTPGTGVTGTLGTITRDDGTLQVTYNGLPLYFFKNDQAPGDANGVYTNWEAVKP
jgi:predicted lipoprotein with Yx(FWY)xxD motif